MSSHDVLQPLVQTRHVTVHAVAAGAAHRVVCVSSTSLFGFEIVVAAQAEGVILGRRVLPLRTGQ